MSYCWFASIELAVSGKQSILILKQRNIPRWNSFWCGLLQCFTSHFRASAVSCPFSPLFSPSCVCFPTGMVPFCPKGPRSTYFPVVSRQERWHLPGISTTCSWPMLCSAELPESVIWETQMYYSALICGRGETCRSGEAYLAKDLQLKNRVICLVLLPVEE